MLLNNLINTTCGKTTNRVLSKLLNELKTRHHIKVPMSTLEPQAEPSVLQVATKPALEYKKQPPPQLRRDKQQQNAKRKTTPYIPGTVSLQVLGAGTNGAPCSVYLFTDQARYLFNCGEGTQRLAHEHKTKLSRLEQIFMTRNTWSMVGGFPGLALTIQDAGVRQLALHGPPHLDSILHSMKRFVVLKNLQVTTNDCTLVHDFEDATMTVKCVPLYKSVETSYSDRVVIAYICKLKPRPGALLLEKCVEHGVPPGPLLGLLKNGIDVTLKNGNIVRSKDVSEPNETALSFIFLDIPAEDFLPSLQAQATTFHNLQLNAESEVALIVHFTPAHILQNNCYQSFIHKFPAKTQHIYLNSPQNSFSGYIAAHRIQYQLNQLNPRIFPLLAECAEVVNSNASISKKLKKTKLTESPAEEENNVAMLTETESNDSLAEEKQSVNSLTNFHLRPRKGMDHSLEAKLNPQEYIEETQQLADFPALLSQLQQTMKTLNVNLTPEYPKITFLGTGSCVPNKTRNVSAILMQPQEDSYILLDCGEGTLGQIMRFFGKTKAEHVMRQLKAIYISHLHADHHIGLIGLLDERRRLFRGERIKKKVLLFAPKQIESWLSFYNAEIEGIQSTYELIGNGSMLEKPLDLSENHEDTGVSTVATCLVRHCPHSFGVSFTMQAPDVEKTIKITYSGDSMPCQDLIDLGRNSTVLIHEATMEDDLIEEAKVKQHSTITQAIQQGRAMQAEHIILTHFSQRYAKLPRMQNGTEEDMRNVAIAFDNMQVSLGDLPHFHLLYPALKALFAEHAEELEQKALKRELKMERKRKLLESD